MKKIISILLMSILLVSGSMIPVHSENAIIYETVVREKVTKGLDYEYKQIFTKDGWVDIHVLIMDLDEEQVAMKILKSTEEFGLRKTLTSLAEEDENFVGGINGSFFNMSESYSDPIGVIYEDGYTSANHNYNIGGNGVASLVEMNNGEFFFDFFGISIKLSNKIGRSLYISGINKLTTNSTSPTIYNELFGPDSTQLDELGSFYKLRVINDVVISVSNPEEVALMPLLDEGYIIAIPSEIADIHLDYFTPGTEIDLVIDSTIDTEDIKFAISGSGKVVENGQIVKIGQIVEENNRHPRTAIGITSDHKLIAMVVDGRGGSIGATHAEVGNYLLDYGVTDAIQLDGGGSSTLISRDLGSSDINVQNSPSDGGQRKVLNGIGFVSLGEIGELETIKIMPSTNTVFKNNPIYLDIIGYDMNYNPIEINQKKIVWNVEGLIGTWKVNTFSPSMAGNGVLTCYYNGLTTSIDFKSLEQPIDLEVTPKILNLDYNQKGSFAITGLDITGYEGSISKGDASYTLENNAIGSFTSGEFTSSNTPGISKVKIQVGERWTTVYIAVGNEKQIMEAFETTNYESRVYPEEIAIGEVTVDHTLYFDTNSSLKFEYDFISSPDSQALYMMVDDFSIEQPTDVISLQLFGNESGHMFKGKVIDATGRAENITFVSNINFSGWKEVSVNLPTDLVYPIKLERLYLVSVMTIGRFSGSINIDALSVMSHLKTDNLKFDDEGFINDELKLQVKPKDTFELKVFGPTAFRNRLLDNILLEKVYEKINQSDYGVFAGTTDIKPDHVDIPYSTWENVYNEFSVEGVKFVQLGTTSGGIRLTDYTQYDKLIQTLATTSENIIVIIGNKNPLKNFADPKEGALLHNILKDYVTKTGKTLMYINAGGYVTDVTIREGIRYFDLSGLWYKIEDRHIALNETFYSLNFYIKSGKVNYMLEPLYPLIEVMGD